MGGREGLENKFNEASGKLMEGFQMGLIKCAVLTFGYPPIGEIMRSLLSSTMLST